MKKQANRLGDATNKIARAFVQIGVEAKVLEDGLIHTAEGVVTVKETYGRKKGTWTLVPKDHPLAASSLFCPSTHESCDHDAQKDLRYIVKLIARERDIDRTQEDRRGLVARTNDVLGSLSTNQKVKAEFVPSKPYLDHIRQNGVGGMAQFVIDVPLEQAPEVAVWIAEMMRSV